MLTAEEAVDLVEQLRVLSLVMNEDAARLNSPLGEGRAQTEAGDLEKERDEATLARLAEIMVSGDRGARSRISIVWLNDLELMVEEQNTEGWKIRWWTGSVAEWDQARLNAMRARDKG